MAAEPFYKHNAATVIDGSDKAIVIPLDIEHHPINPYDARVSIILLHIAWLFPFRVLDLMEPSALWTPAVS